jgi:hypothetical protein
MIAPDGSAPSFCSLTRWRLVFRFAVLIASTGGSSLFVAVICFLATGVTGVAVLPFAKGVLKVWVSS